MLIRFFCFCKSKSYYFIKFFLTFQFAENILKMLSIHRLIVILKENDNSTGNISR